MWHSVFIDRMKRSRTAMLACLPTAPNRARTLPLRHQLLKVLQKNWRPLSVMMTFGFAPARLVT